MKKITTALMSVLVTAVSLAQENKNIEVSYKATSPSFSTKNIAPKPKQFILIANASESKFYSPMTEYIDSLKSTPEGEAKYKEISRNAFSSGNYEKVPKRDGSYYVLKSESTGTITTYDVNGLEKYVMTETSPEWKWEISDSTKNILGYECLLAKTEFHGRVWNVWFTPEIPVMNGPWKLGGLPGIILEAYDQTGAYCFTANGIQQTSRNITPVYSSESYDKIDRKDFLKAKRKMNDNPVAQMNAQLSGLGISIQANANTLKHKSREEVDFIETDY